jgi:glucose/arabinose dehydrogenase
VRRTMLAALAVTTCLSTAWASPAGAAVGLDDPIPAAIPASGVTVGTEVVADGLVSPTKGVAAPDGAGLVVLDQGGQVWAVGTGRTREQRRRGHEPRAPRLVADLSGLAVSNLGKVIPGLAYDERGLLGIAFARARHRSRLVYTFGNENATAPADFSTLPAGVPADSQLVLREWRLARGHHDSPVIDQSSSRVLLRIDKPQFNHNGGDLAFGPDGLLYVSVGDGGNADDQGPGHVAGGNAQSLLPGNVMGKILRIDPRGHNSANGEYGIPRSNPFVGRDGADEIWAYGFRNPYRFSFDKKTGALLVGDVGQNDIEEADVVQRGHNYGWPIKEGTFLFDNNGDGNGFVTANSPGAPAGLSDPVAQYDHTAPGGVRCPTGGPTSCEGIAVVGGYVYRGRDVHALKGHYVFGDYSRAFAQPLGRLFIARNGQTQELAIAGRASLGLAVTGWAQDSRGELYVLGNETGVLSGTTGQVVRLTDAGGHHRARGRYSRHG